ncbi:MAG: hypothetical protein LBL31_00780, partial [Spirochaetaceae bacterium]|nr:hypothetical protein [Spirochaetaceae bacterium]
VTANSGEGGNFPYLYSRATAARLPEDHQGCLANETMRAQQPMSKKRAFYGKEIITCWLPVDGYPGLFIHFAISIA